MICLQRWAGIVGLRAMATWRAIPSSSLPACHPREGKLRIQAGVLDLPDNKETILKASTWRWLIAGCVSFGRRAWIFTDKSTRTWDWLSEVLQLLKRSSVNFQGEVLAVCFTLTVHPGALEAYGSLWLLLLVQTLPWELTGGWRLEAIHFPAISVEGQSVLVDVREVGLTRDFCEISASHSPLSCHGARW